MAAELALGRNLILALWVVWALYWIQAARLSKPVRRREPLVWRIAFLAQALLTAVMLGPRSLTRWLGMQVIGGGWVRFWIAVGIIAAGLVLSIWARRVLGGNWSGSVTLKEGHELVQDGPYRRIRHPIYSGVLLMILGTALASARVQGLLAFAIAFVALFLKSRVEERWMELEFPERYMAYKRGSGALIPRVFYQWSAR
jgi:protein-S-isoprenylcysteine O-methyltransferase Ste14